MAKRPKKHENRVTKNIAPAKPAPRPKGKWKPDPDERWIKTRMHELGKSVEEAAKFFDTYTNMVWRMTSGSRPVRPDELARWATFLEVPFPEAARRFGIDVPPSTVSLIGVLRANGRVTLYPPNQQKRVEAPTDGGPELVCVVVESPQSALAVWDGTFLYYEPTKVFRADAFGRLSVVEFGDVGAPIVGFLDRASVGRARVTVFGSSEVIESAQPISATPVKWTRAG